MRPFKFFFAISLAVFFFFFIARFVIMAAIAAAILSFVFFVGRKIKNFFRALTWEDPYYADRDYRFEKTHQRPPAITVWQDEFLSDFSKHRRAYSTNYQVIEIR